MSNENEKGRCCSEQTSAVPGAQPCCGGPATGGVEFPLYNPAQKSGPPVFSPRPHWIKGFVKTAAGQIPLVDTSLVFRDISGGWKARWGINRMDYKIPPGLYGVGNPNEESPVLVTANYKMSFDSLRRELPGLDAWIMVIDTNGINVWCAAGKGTFGTAEIVKRLSAVHLSRIVSHRTIILPQLGAPGVAAHEVRRLSGFRVAYGPVRARDIKEFLGSGMKATREMRIVEFGFLDRLFLTPIELVGIRKPLVILAAAALVVHLAGLITISFSSLYPFIGAILIGTVVTPALLPWVPGRAFALKGWFLGLLWTLAVLYVKEGSFSRESLFNSLALLLVLPSISAFQAMYFTGASTYTSLSGVKKEIRFAMPAIVASASAGVASWLAGLFIYH